MITEQAEIKFWHWLKNKLSKEKVDMQRIENTTGNGVPDVNACYLGSEAWIELKVHVKGNVVLRKEQYAWLTRRHQHDGNVLVMALTENDGVEIWTPPFIGRRWGNQGKYVALTGEPEFLYNKRDPIGKYLKAIFDI